jgi:hypothetical protein
MLILYITAEASYQTILSRQVEWQLTLSELHSTTSILEKTLATRETAYLTQQIHT